MKTFKRAYLIDALITALLYAVAGFFFLLLLAVGGYIVIKGLQTGNLSLIFSPQGMGNQLFNTVYLVILSLLISTPLGVITGIYLAEYAATNRTNRFIRLCIETLSSLPSIVIGLFGYLVFILLTGAKWNLLAGALTVSILNIPLIATTTEDALKSLPPVYKRGSYGLGATKWQTVRFVLLPACLPQIITGIILAAGRSLGEAAALLYTAGMSTDINWQSTNVFSPTHPLNPFRPGETLSLYIWGARTEALAANAADAANLASTVLILAVFIFSLGARLLSLYFKKKMTGA